MDHAVGKDPERRIAECKSYEGGRKKVVGGLVKGGNEED